VEESDKSPSTDSWEPEHRLVISIGALIGPPIPAQPETITVFVRFEDAINRQVFIFIQNASEVYMLRHKLIHYYFNPCDILAVVSVEP